LKRAIHRLRAKQGEKYQSHVHHSVNYLDPTANRRTTKLAI
jgi:hypothetical protein